MPYPVLDIDTAGSGTVRHAKPRTVLRRRSQSFHEPRNFPPAMPLLAWTGNGNVQMPWVLKRSYTDNGRLVIHEVKVRRHDFFRASRADGRLTLHRMHMDEPEEMEALEPKEKEEKRVRSSLLRPGPLPKREKHRLLLAPPSPHLLATRGREDQETKKKKKKKKEEEGKESFEELKRMEQGLFRLPVSSSASALSSLAAAASSATATEKTDAVVSLLRQGNCKRLSDVSRASSLPSITSSVPELLLGANGGTGGGGGWPTDNRSDSNSPLQQQIPAIGPVQS
ncbi:hypothetical protein ACLOJK_016131 [Asimina triloba]